MNFYTTPHKHYCGIDLHARSMYVCVLSQQGVVLLHRNLRCDAQMFLLAIQPFREDLVVAVGASTAGTGSRICVARKASPSSWVMLST